MRSQRLAIQSLSITCLVTLAAESRAMTDLRDIRGPVFSRELPPFALTGALLLLGVFFAFLLRRRGAPAAAPETPPASRSDSPENLTSLADDYRNGRISVQTLFIGMATLINHHLLAAAGLAPAPMTTDEILLRTLPVLPHQEHRQAAEALRLCDRVKFAAHQPAAQEVSAALDLAAGILSRGAGGQK